MLSALRGLMSLAAASEGWYGAFTTGLLAYLVAATGQALTTGLGQEFVSLCMVMGAYRAAAPRAPNEASSGAAQAGETVMAEPTREGAF